MRCCLPSRLSVVITALMFAAPVCAEVTLNAGARLSHENNVNGSPDSPSKANQVGDYSLALSASAVYFTPLDAAQTDYFIGQIGVLATQYDKFNNLDNSMVMASVGYYKQLSDTWSGQVTGRAFGRDTRQHARDSNGFGATLEIKKQMTEKVWLKAVADYEDSRANLTSFSNSGATYGVNLGYLPEKDTFINLGYSQGKRDYKSVAPFVSKSEMLFVEATQRLAKNWYLSVGYAFQDNNSNIAGTAYTNHIVSAGLNFSY